MPNGILCASLREGIGLERVPHEHAEYNVTAQVDHGNRQTGQTSEVEGMGSWDRVWRARRRSQRPVGPMQTINVPFFLSINHTVSDGPNSFDIHSIISLAIDASSLLSASFPTLTPPSQTAASLKPKDQNERGRPLTPNILSCRPSDPKRRRECRRRR